MPSQKAKLGKLLVEGEEKRARAVKVAQEARLLQQELDLIDIKIWILQHDISDNWESVPPEEWENLQVGEEVALAIRRPKDDEQFKMYGEVYSNGGWGRFITDNNSNFSAVDYAGHPIEPQRGITVRIWRKTNG